MIENWQELPRVVHPVRCHECGESWFCRSLGSGGTQDRDFWPRFCCYCGMQFSSATIHEKDGSVTDFVGMDGKPADPPPA